MSDGSRRGDPDIHVPSCLECAQTINALQRIADIVIQKSTAKVGLTVTEGLEREARDRRGRRRNPHPGDELPDGISRQHL